MAYVLVFCVPCALMSISLDPTHLVTCLLINFPQLLSLVTLLPYSLYNLLVFAVPCGFIAICWFAVVSLVLPCQFVIPLWGCFCLFYLSIKSLFSSCNWVLALIPSTQPDTSSHLPWECLCMALFKNLTYTKWVSYFLGGGITCVR